jgi:hypothetical protein
LDRTQLLTLTILKQGYVAPRIKSSQQKLHGLHYEVVDSNEVSISQMAIDLFPFV